MILTTIKEDQLHRSIVEKIEQGGGGGGGINPEELYEIKRELAHLKAVTELKDRVDGASGLFFDLFDRANEGSVARVDNWERDVDFLPAGANSFVFVEYNAVQLRAGQEITIQHKSNPDVFERAYVESVSLAADGITYTVTLKAPVVNDYSDGAVVYRSKGFPLAGSWLFGARRTEIGDVIFPPDSILTEVPTGAAFSPDGRFLAICLEKAPYLAIYKRVGTEFIRLPDPSAPPTSRTAGVAFSPNGRYLGVSHEGVLGFSVYEIVGDTFEKLPTPQGPNVTGPHGIAFSPDSQHVAVANGSTTGARIVICRIQDKTITRLPDPTQMPDRGNSVAYSPDGKFLYAMGFSHGLNTSVLYERKDDTYIPIPNPPSFYRGTQAAFSPDSRHLAVGYETLVPSLKVFKIEADGSWTEITGNVSPAPTTMVSGVAFSPDSRYLVIGVGSEVRIYERQGDSYIQFKTLTLPAAVSKGIAFSPRSDFMVVPYGTSPCFTIYGTDVAYAPMKLIDLRYNIHSPSEISSLVAWIERERETNFALDVAVSIHQGQELYQPAAVTTAPVDGTHDEIQAVITTAYPATQATLRITATMDDPDAVAKIRRITGAIS